MNDLVATLDLLETYNLTLVVVGLGVLGLATLLHRCDDLPFSFPIVAFILGCVVGILPLGLPVPTAKDHGLLAVHLTEIGVILSLMGVGLKLDRMPNLRTWSVTWRLLIIAMPLTIAGVALLGGSVLALTPAAALLLGASLAPTDPVLASDVQVGEPEKKTPEGTDDETAPEDDSNADEHPEEREDELRFALTSEAGLNDSLAFPFTYLALLMVVEGNSPSEWLGQWLLVDVAYRLIVGVIAGVLIGWGLSQILLRLPVDTERQKMQTGVAALAATLLLYGLTECVGGYGFLAVFIGSVVIRQIERTQQSHRSLHVFAEQSEQLLMTVILIALGAAVTGGLLQPLTWQAAVVGVLIVFVIRPVAGWVSLLGTSRLSLFDRGIVSFFGIRGIGCLYYLAYALEKETFADADLLWAVCSFTIVLSICVHGITAAPVMNYRERRKKRLGNEDELSGRKTEPDHSRGSEIASA